MYFFANQRSLKLLYLCWTNSLNTLPPSGLQLPSGMSSICYSDWSTDTVARFERLLSQSQNSVHTCVVFDFWRTTPFSTREPTQECQFRILCFERLKASSWWLSSAWNSKEKFKIVCLVYRLLVGSVLFCPYRNCSLNCKKMHSRLLT